MKKRYLNPKQLSEPRFYSHAVAVEGAATLVPDLLLEVELAAVVAKKKKR